MCCCDFMTDLCLVVLLIFFPPLAVWIRRGCCSADAWLNILLCILGYFPGLIHSWYIIARYPPCSGNHGSKVYYVYQSPGDLEAQRHNNQSHHHSHPDCSRNVLNEPSNQSGPNYGATGASSSTNQSDAMAPPAYSVLASGKYSELT